MIDGIAAIRREFAQLPDRKPKGYWNAGSVAKECLQYVLDKEAGSDPNDHTFQGGLKRDCDADGNLLHTCDAAGNVRNTRRRADGRGMRLADFLAHHDSVDCALEEAEVAGIRLYSTAAFEFINNPLPITVAFIRDGLRKLRAKAAHSERANRQVLAMTCPRTEHVAAPRNPTNLPLVVSGGPLPRHEERGNPRRVPCQGRQARSWRPPMSTTSNLEVAMK